jgi:uncharacterized protein YlzI (FlbEa/FlbD family)
MTTQGMWQMLSDLLDGEKLPESLNKDIYDLCEGKAFVVRESNEELVTEINELQVKYDQLWDESKRIYEDGAKIIDGLDKIILRQLKQIEMLKKESE